MNLLFTLLLSTAQAEDTCTTPVWMTVVQTSVEQMELIYEGDGCLCAWERLPGTYAFVMSTPYEISYEVLEAQVLVRGGFSEIPGTSYGGVCSSSGFTRGTYSALSRIAKGARHMTSPTILGVFSNPQTETNILYYRVPTTGKVFFKTEMMSLCQEGCGFLKAARPSISL